MKTKKPFTILPHSVIDKWIEVAGPDLAIRVDYDDVDHNAVMRNLKEMVGILNTYWDPQ